MSKINISFNNKNYSIDESSLSAANAALKSHLSTTMSGSGATINFAGVPYNIDSAKLSAATNDFISHLGTIAGSGHKVMVNGVEYGIDSTKVQGAISELEATFSGTGEERLEGDGAEYYTLAPTALSFRSTAPLNELQEVQINGVTVDPSNYTLEEGSTIVTFPIDYLKTLNVGNYEVAVASESKTVKGGFNVKAPELNEHGFYYNQPYIGDVSAVSCEIAFFVRDDGTFDSIAADGGTETGSYEISGNTIIAVSPLFGQLNCTISSNGTEIFCNELQTAFKLGNNTSITADEDYIYIYKEDLGGYEVTAIDKTKAEYGAIKTGINGIDTVKLSSSAFYGNKSLVTAPKIPSGVVIIGEAALSCCPNLTRVELPASVTVIERAAFADTNRLTQLVFSGTMAQWNAIDIGYMGNFYATYVQCSDGQVAL